MDKPFLEVISSDRLMELIGEFEALGREEVPLEAATHRTLASTIISEDDVPGFNRSTMDGFAVRARDTFGASESAPALLELKGEIPMAKVPDQTVKRGETYRIWTGGALPEGADAVVMLERVEELDADTVEVLQAVAPYENVIKRGEDIRSGEKILLEGARLRPADLGALAALGVSCVNVFKRPRMALISSGDEIIPVEQALVPGHIRDVNRYCITAMAIKAHAEPVWMGIVKDDLDSVDSALKSGLKECDLVVFSGASSMGRRDFLIDAIKEQKRSEILAHGVSVSPGKPLILAKAQGKPIVGLPGHPVSAMICFERFAIPLLRKLEGERRAIPYLSPTVSARLSRNVPSKEGRLDFIRVRLERDNGKVFAKPIVGKSGMISTMVKAHGYIEIPEDCEGMYKNQAVHVTLLSDWTNEDGI